MLCPVTTSQENGKTVYFFEILSLVFVVHCSNSDWKISEGLDEFHELKSLPSPFIVSRMAPISVS